MYDCCLIPERMEGSLVCVEARMRTQSVQFKASDGKKLFVRHFNPDGQPRAILLVAHGMAEHSFRYAAFATFLAAQGIAVRIPDLRGHGETGKDGEWGILAHSGGFDRCVLDLVEIGKDSLKKSPGVGVWLFGHSFGSLLAMALLERSPSIFSGCVLSGVPAKPAMAMDVAGSLVIAIGSFFRGPRSPAALPKAMTFGAYARSVPSARTDCDWISRDPEVVAAYMADPACSFTCSYSFYRDLQGGIRSVYRPDSLARIPKDIPLYYFCGDCDPVVGGEKGFREQDGRFQSLGLKDYTSRAYPGGRHEMLNETVRKNVYEDFSAWLLPRIQSPPGRV